MAQQLFLEKGYDNTTIQDIVDKLGGLTKGAVYHHFKSKEDIICALSDKMFSDCNPFIEVKKREDLSPCFLQMKLMSKQESYVKKLLPS